MSERRPAPRQAALAALYLAAIIGTIALYLLVVSLIGIPTAPAGRFLGRGAIVLTVLASALALASGERFRRTPQPGAVLVQVPQGGAEQHPGNGPAALKARRSF
jgi:hypothetical protein